MRYSIVVTTFNRPTQLGACLAALANLQYPREAYEVIVVDDGGSVPLDPVISAVRGAMNVQLVRKENGGPASGRNLGASMARGAYLAFSDDDCEPTALWLCAVDERLRSHPHAVVGGRTVNGLRHNPYSTASQVIVDVVYAWYNRDPDRARFFATNNMVVPTDLYRARGGLDEEMRVASEDREFCRRWIHDGGTMVYAPNAVVVHRHGLTLGSFLRQHLAYGRGAALFYRRRRRYRARGSVLAEMSFYPGLIFRYMRAAKRSGLAWGPALALFGLWQGANAVGFIREWLLGPRAP